VPAVVTVKADLPHIIAQGVSTSVTTAVAAATAVAPRAVPQPQPDVRIEGPSGETVERINGAVTSTAPSGASVTVYPPDAKGRKKIVTRSPNGATAVAYAYAYGDDRAERARGVTPEYIGAMRAAIPRLVELDVSDFTQLRAIGVTPEYARDLAAAGFPSISAHDLVEARAVGVTGSYIKSMRAAGMRGDLDDFVQLRAVGVDPAFAERVRAAGIKVADADDLVELRVLGTAHGGTHESRIRVKIKRDERSRDDGGNPDANPDPDDDPDG
jgi:hypothetical protein